MQIAQLTDGVQLIHQVGAAGLLVWVLEQAKRATWIPWLGQHTDFVNRTISIITATATAAGFSLLVKGNWDTGGTVTLSFPPAAQVADVILRSIGQIILQEAVYRGVIKPT